MQNGVQQGQREPILPVFYAQLLVGTDFLARNTRQTSPPPPRGWFEGGRTGPGCTGCRNTTFLSFFFLFSIFIFSGGYCELSDIELRDLRPNKDYNVDQRFRLYTWDFDDHRCYGSPKIEYPAIGTNSCTASDIFI